MDQAIVSEHPLIYLRWDNDSRDSFVFQIFLPLVFISVGVWVEILQGVAGSFISQKNLENTEEEIIRRKREISKKIS